MSWFLCHAVLIHMFIREMFIIIINFSLAAYPYGDKPKDGIYHCRITERKYVSEFFLCVDFGQL